MDASGGAVFTMQVVIIRAPDSFIQNLHHVRHSLPAAKLPHARAKLQHASRIRRDDHLRASPIDGIHFLAEQRHAPCRYARRYRFPRCRSTDRKAASP